MSTSRNTGTNHKGKTVQTVNFVTFFCLSFFSKLGYSQNTEHNHNKRLSVFSTISLLRICWMPMGHRARVAASVPPQISYPCWALQSNTERNLPSTFSVFSHIFQLLSSHNFFFHGAENFIEVTAFNWFVSSITFKLFQITYTFSKLFGSHQAQHNSASFQTFFLLVTLDFLFMGLVFHLLQVFFLWLQAQQNIGVLHRSVSKGCQLCDRNMNKLLQVSHSQVLESSISYTVALGGRNEVTCFFVSVLLTHKSISR